MLFKHISCSLKNLNVIRATSPLDGESIWVEFFPNNVSKGHAAALLCKKLTIDQEHTFSIGNDYNDLDLLYFTRHSFITDNAPSDIKNLFTACPSNSQNGFTIAIEQTLL